MPQFRDFLDRFRPAPAPGAASRLGVASDRARDLSDELQPVLALLMATHAECERIIASAHRDALQIAGEAQQQAAAIAGEAQRTAEAARAAAADQVLSEARAQANTGTDDARQRAQSWPQASDQQVSALVGAALELVVTLPHESLAE